VLADARRPSVSLIAVPGVLSTITLPLRSTIVPRGASTLTVRNWLSWAAAR